MKGQSVIVDEEFCFEEETFLTVLKTSVFFAGDGFYVYDCSGDVLFRVDSYGSDIRHSVEVIVMDIYGNCVLTVKRKRPSLHQRWEGFIGERSHGQKPIFSVRKVSIIGGSSMTVEMYCNGCEEYQIEGSNGQKSCKVYNTNREVVAEIQRKVHISTHAALGKDVFSLWLKPGFDCAFAMGLVVVLDHINGDDFGDDGHDDGDDDEDDEMDPIKSILAADEDIG